MTTPADQASEALNAAVRAFADNPTPETQATLEAAQRAALGTFDDCRTCGLALTEDDYGLEGECSDCAEGDREPKALDFADAPSYEDCDREPQTLPAEMRP